MSKVGLLILRILANDLFLSGLKTKIQTRFLGHSEFLEHFSFTGLRIQGQILKFNLFEMEAE